MDDVASGSSVAPLVCSLQLRPFAKGTVLAYELVLKRAQGDRIYDRSLCYLNSSDARDLYQTCPQIDLVEAYNA